MYQIKRTNTISLCLDKFYLKLSKQRNLARKYMDLPKNKLKSNMTITIKLIKIWTPTHMRLKHQTIPTPECLYNKFQSNKRKGSQNLMPHKLP